MVSSAAVAIAQDDVILLQGGELAQVAALPRFIVLPLYMTTSHRQAASRGASRHFSLYALRQLPLHRMMSSHETDTVGSQREVGL